MEAEQLVQCSNHWCSKIEKIAVMQAQLKSWQSNIVIMLNIYKNDHIIIPSSGKDQKNQRKDATEEKDPNPMYLLGESLTIIRTMA